MLVGGCPWELSGRKTTPEDKERHNLKAKPTCSGAPWRDLQFPGHFLEMFFDGV
jgi:hypothetical protein